MATVEPTATYRFQLTPEFGFDAVVDLLDHVGRLGASHVYLSPIAQAVPESSHGYDVVDHTRIRAEFGGEAAFDRLLGELDGRGMAAVIDHVPNHVASTRPDLNPHWWALLRDGPGSAADRWFDVDWDAAGGRVVLPVLGAPLDEAIAEGAVVRDGDAIVVHGERRLPLRPGSAGAGSLADMLAAQHYSLRHWRDPVRNVRRFFTIDDLVAVCVDDPEVAAVVDTIPARYASVPGFGGVRLDHIDGLADPLGYLTGLRERIGDDVLVWVEKIVVAGEWLPTSWPVDGTTGYEFARTCDHLVLDRRAEPVLERWWREASGDERSFHDWERDARREVVDGTLRPDFERLTRIAVDAIDAIGASGVAVESELAALTIGLPRYRTYLPDDPDAAGLIGAISDGAVAQTILDPGDDPSAVELRTRWQQLTGPVMAKGAEDRSFYRYLRLASLCEVGGDPGSFGASVDEFHAEGERRARDWPRNLLTGSTHDTKRSEDVRARSAALTWRIGTEPARAADYWEPTIERLADGHAIDRVSAGLALQTALTTTGIDAVRLASYLVKAAREAATHTTWEDPDAAFESRLETVAVDAVEAAADDPLGLDQLAVAISLATTTLRLTAPGIPDVYQGAEGLTYRLVDPDNRVAPDWDELRGFVSDERTVADAWSDHSPAVKTLLVRTLLDLRRRRAESFGVGGSYRPIDAGPGSVAYRRGDDVVVVVRRGAAHVDGSIILPAGNWYDVLDPAAPTLRGEIAAASAVGSDDDGTLPVAVFERE